MINNYMDKIHLDMPLICRQVVSPHLEEITKKYLELRNKALDELNEYIDGWNKEYDSLHHNDECKERYFTFLSDKENSIIHSKRCYTWGTFELFSNAERDANLELRFTNDHSMKIYFKN